jgi:DNA-binding IclR family transcriptional regulator
MHRQLALPDHTIYVVKNTKTAAKTTVVETAERDAAGPRSLTRILGLFDVLAKNSDGLSLAELNSILESPKSSLLNLLRPLVADGYLLHTHGLYRLGPTVFRLAGNIMSVWNFSKMFHPYVEELATRSHESAYIGVLDRDEKVITYVDTIDSAQSVRYSIAVGAHRPLYCTAAGRVLLAYADKDWQEDYLRTTRLDPHTPFTVTDRRELRHKLEGVRQTGISMSISEMFEGSAAVSAPIFGNDGKVIAAIAIGAPSNRFASQLQNLKKIVSEVAARASGSTSDVQLPQIDDTPASTATTQQQKAKKTKSTAKKPNKAGSKA